MLNFKLFLFAALALFAFSSMAAVTGKFNIASKYTVEKIVNGKKTTEEQRNTISHQKELKSDKVLDRMVKDFGTWSSGEFKCSKSVAGSIYNVQATKVYKNKDESTTANNRAKTIINSHTQDE